MSYNNRCVSSLLTQMNTAQNSAQARNAFTEGLLNSSIWDKIGRRTLNETGRFPYDFAPKQESIQTVIPEPDSCGSNPIALLGGNESTTQYQYADRYKLNLRLCKDDCKDEATVLSKIIEQERQVGAGFGLLLDSMFWNGNAAGGAGIFYGKGASRRNLTTTAFNALNNADATTLANFFSQIMANKDDPCIYLGSATLELLGWRALNSADGCSELWDCVINTLANRLNQTPDQIRARFRTFDDLDHVTGIDPVALADAHSVIIVIDKDAVEMGTSDSPELGCPFPEGEDIGVVSRKMILTSPIITKDCAIEFIFGFIDVNDVNAQADAKYCDQSDRPKLVVPQAVCS